MEEQNGIKTLLEFLKDRLTNKFFLPYIFFFFSYNWPLLIYLFFNDTNGKDKKVFDYIKNPPGYSWSFPFLITVVFVLLSPWINLFFEAVSIWPNRQRKMFGLNTEILLASKRQELAALMAAALEGEEKEREIKSRVDGSRMDVERFNRMENSMSELDIRTFLASLRGDILGSPNFIQFERYLMVLESVENMYSNEALKLCQEGLVESFRAVSGQIRAVYEKRETANGPRYIKKETMAAKTHDDFLSSVDAALKEYGAYRAKIREILGK